MSTLLVIDPDKLRAARGDRTRAEIAAAGGRKFTEQQLYGWERGDYRPRPESIPALLKALGVGFESIARPLVA